MSRRIVSVCILALAGITSFSSGLTKKNTPGGVSFASQARIPELSRTSRVLSHNSGNMAGREAATSAPANRRCAQPRRCLASLAIPLSFERNLGQFAASVQYAARAAGMVVLLTRRGMALHAVASSRSRGAGPTDAVRVSVGWDDGGGRRRGRDLRFAWRGEQRIKTVSNYFIGRNPRDWRTNVPHFARAAAESTSRARVGVVVYGTNDGIEYDLRLEPGADASKLRLRFAGVQHVTLSDGDVVLETGERKLRMANPKVYDQLPGGSRKTVDGAYVMEADGSIGFKIGAHDPRATLVVDPTLTVSYATFLGGAGNETAGNVAVDGSGNIYVSGVTTSSTSFPESSAAAIGPVISASAFYVAKIDPTVTGASSLVYLTFMGGSGTQSGGLIAVDSAGDVALTGTTTSTDYPVTGSSQPTAGLTSGSGNDAVVSEISAEGNQLNFSVYFGGTGTLSVNGPGGIAVDSSGNVDIASDVQPSADDTASPDLPVVATAGAAEPFQSTWDQMPSDGFLAVFAPPPQPGGAPSLTYCTYLGTLSAGPVVIGGLAVDSGGDAYIAGSADDASNGFPVQNAIQTSYGGGSSDGFVMQIAPQGQGASDLIYATLLGGNGMDEILAIAVDPPDTLPVGIPPKVYVTGETQSINFPTQGAYQSTLQTCKLQGNCSFTNAFLAVIAQDSVSHQTSLAYSTYLGGSGSDAGQAIAVAAANSVYVAGQTTSPDFPWHDNLQPFNGGADAFLANLDPTSSGTASLLYATPLGGTSPAGGNVSASASGVAVTGAGPVYVTGQTTASDFPTAVTTSGTANGFQQSCASCQEATPGSDAFAVAISESATAGPSVSFSSGALAFGSHNFGTVIAQPAAVLNSGDQTLTISNIETFGPNSADFSVQTGPGCLQQPIPPSVSGSSPQCSVEINFAASVGGPEQAFLGVWDNAPGSPQILELDGSGVAPHANIAPSNLNFGNQPINSTSQSQQITITNSGTENLTISQINPPTSAFTSSGGNCGSGISLLPGQYCELFVVFAPTSTGPFQGQIEIVDNSDSQSNAEQIVSLSGTGTQAVPTAQVLPLSLTFASQQVGTSSASQIVTLTNKGSADLTITAISVGGANSVDFEVSATGTTCPTTGGTVAIGGDCTVALVFAPQSAGTSKAATLSFADNATGSPQTVTLAGGVATAPASLTVSPASLSFGSQGEGTASSAQIVTITNSGSSGAGLSGIAITGSTDFAQQNACAPVLSAGANCQVSVTFVPSGSAGPGTRTGTLSIPGGTPASVPLSGIATQPAISFTTSLSFASQLVGTASASQPITITNSSSGLSAGALAFTGISINGANKADFSITSNQCSSAGAAGVSPGKSCTVQIAFQPQPSATCGGDPNRSASLQLQDNAPGTPQIIPLSGLAADFCLATANGQPVTTPIQPGQTASYSLEVASAGGFTGAVNLSCSIASAGAEIGPCAIATNPASNPASVQLTPTAAGQFMVSVPTVAPSAAFRPASPPGNGPHEPFAATVFVGLMCLFFLVAVASTARRNRFGSLLARPIRFVAIGALAAALAVAVAGCGSGGSNSDPATDPGTPPGTYTITVTASTTDGGNSTTRTATLMLTVAPPSS